jgi:hypothetical protein
VNSENAAVPWESYPWLTGKIGKNRRVVARNHAKVHSLLKRFVQLAWLQATTPTFKHNDPQLHPPTTGFLNFAA